MLHRVEFKHEGCKVFSEKLCGTIIDMEQHIIESAIGLYRKPFNELEYRDAWQIANAVAYAYFDEDNATDYLDDVQGMYDKRFECED